MEEETKKELIISTIENEKHLGENLKKILIDYIEQLEEENKKKDKRLNRQFKLLQKKDKETEELKADNNHQWEERCKLTFELDDSIPKSKVKEKIEELKKKHCLYCHDCNKSEDCIEEKNVSCDIGLLIEVLQELLGDDE